MNPLELSGLDLVQAIIDGSIPHPSMADTIPMRISAAARGYVKFCGVHGGFAATVLDSVTGST